MNYSFLTLQICPHIKIFDLTGPQKESMPVASGHCLTGNRKPETLQTDPKLYLTKDIAQTPLTQKQITKL